MVLLLSNIIRHRIYPKRINFILNYMRFFGKKNVRIERRATIPPRYESHEQVLKSKLFTPESLNSNDLSHIFFQSYKLNLLDLPLLDRYIDRARVLSPQLSIKGFSLVLHTLSKYLTNEFQQISNENHAKYEIVDPNYTNPTNLFDSTSDNFNDHDQLEKNNSKELFNKIIKLITTISAHLPSRLRYSQPKDLGMVALSLTKLNTLITTFYDTKLIKTDYFKSLENIIKRIANEAPSKLPFFEIPELTALALSFSCGNLPNLPWYRLALYDLSVEMVDKLEFLLVEHLWSESLANDVLSFVCSMDRANVDNRGFWVYITQFLNNHQILSTISANNAVVLANAIYKWNSAEMLLQHASRNLESIDAQHVPRVVSLGLFVSFYTKSEEFHNFLKLLNVELINQLNCIQLTQVANCINTLYFSYDQFDSIKNAIHDRIGQLIVQGKMTIKGSISILSTIAAKSEFSPLTEQLIAYTIKNVSLIDQKCLDSLIKIQSNLPNGVSELMINGLIDLAKRRLFPTS